MGDADMNSKRSLRPENIAKLQEQLVIEEVSLALAACRFTRNTYTPSNIVSLYLLCVSNMPQQSPPPLSLLVTQGWGLKRGQGELDFPLKDR